MACTIILIAKHPKSNLNDDLSDINCSSLKLEIYCDSFTDIAILFGTADDETWQQVNELLVLEIAISVLKANINLGMNTSDSLPRLNTYTSRLCPIASYFAKMYCASDGPIYTEHLRARLRTFILCQSSNLNVHDQLHYSYKLLWKIVHMDDHTRVSVFIVFGLHFRSYHAELEIFNKRKY